MKSAALACVTCSRPSASCTARSWNCPKPSAIASSPRPICSRPWAVAGPKPPTPCPEISISACPARDRVLPKSCHCVRRRTSYRRWPAASGVSCGSGSCIAVGEIVHLRYRVLQRMGLAQLIHLGRGQQAVCACLLKAGGCTNIIDFAPTPRAAQALAQGHRVDHCLQGSVEQGHVAVTRRAVMTIARQAVPCFPRCLQNRGYPVADIIVRAVRMAAEWKDQHTRQPCQRAARQMLQNAGQAVFNGGEAV